MRMNKVRQMKAESKTGYVTDNEDENHIAVDKSLDSVCQDGVALPETSTTYSVTHHQSFHPATQIKDTDVHHKELPPNVSTAPSYPSTELDLLNHQNQQNIYRSMPSINLISPSSIPSPSVSAKQSILKPEGPFQPYGSYLYSIPGFSAFQPLQYAPVPTSNPTINTNVKIGCSSNTNYPIMSSMQNVAKSEMQTVPGDKMTASSESFDVKVDSVKENVPTITDKGSVMMETDFEEQFLTEIVPQTKPIKPTVSFPEIHNKKTVQFLPQLKLPDENSTQVKKTVSQGLNDDRFSLKTSIPISKIDMKSITSHTDTVFSPGFTRGLPTSKTFSTVNEKFEAKSTEEILVKEPEKEISEKSVTEVQESKLKQQVFLHNSSPEMVAGNTKIVIDNNSKIVANIIPTMGQYGTEKIANENDSVSIGFEGKNMKPNNTFSISSNTDDMLRSNVVIGCNMPSETPSSAIINRALTVSKPVIENFPIDGLKSNIKMNEPEQKKKYVFVPATNVNNPKLMLAISQKPSNPNSILVTKGKLQEERLPSRLQTSVKKPKDNLLLTETVPEHNSKVVALKRLHQDNGDENDFENLITENQIYGNKIVIKEKVTAGIVPEKVLPTKKTKVTDCNPDPDIQTGNFVVQPNILYVGNLQLQPTSSNFVVLGNKPIYSQITNEDQKFLVKTDGNDVNTVITAPTSDNNQQADLPNKVLVGQTFRTVNPITHTVSYVKTNNVIEPSKQNNVLQNLLNKPNLKMSESQNHQKIVGQRVVGQLVNNQIVYQVPMIIDREGAINRTVNVMKPGYVNSELAMLLSKQPNLQTEEWRNNSTRLMQAMDRKESDKSKNVEKSETAQSHFKAYVMNIKPDSPVEEVISSLDLAEKRRRMKRKKKFLLQDLKNHSKNTVPKPVDSYNNNNKLVYNRCSGSHDPEDCDENDTQSEEEENLFITNGPTLPLDSSGEKMNFMSIFELTTKVGKNEKELEKLERSLKQDSVSQARLSIIDSAPISPDAQVSHCRHTSLSPAFCGETSTSNNREDDDKKMSFFNGLELCLVSNEYKIDHEHLWRKFTADRRKASEMPALNEYFEKSSYSQSRDIPGVIDHSVDLHGQLRRITEIKKSVTENNNLIKKKLDKMYCMSAKDDNEEVEIPLLAELNFCEITKLSNMANRSLKMIGRQQSTNEEQEYDIKNSGGQMREDGFKDYRYRSDGYVPKICIPSVPKIISLKSMQLSSSVDISPATSMDEPRNSAAGSKMLEISGLESGKIDYRETNEATEQIQELSPSCRPKVDASCQSYRWPGISAVLESYRRYTEEREDEKELLLSENKRLHKELVANQTEAVALNNDLRHALAEQQMCEEQRRSIQRSLDVLNNCIRHITAP